MIPKLIHLCWLSGDPYPPKIQFCIDSWKKHLPDYEIMQLSGLKCCPADAALEIQELADYISFRNGGDGAVRDVIEQTMRLQGTWFDTDAHIW